VKLPLVNTFSPPCEILETIEPTFDEMLSEENFHRRIQTRLEACISNAYDAATYIAKVGADNRLGDFINYALDNSDAYKSWRKAMPSKTPDELSRYKKCYPHCNFEQVSVEIEMAGHVLSEGQYLFHAGLWPTSGNHFLTNRPLSSSFCPQVALRNADHKGKGYDAGQIDLFVLMATNPKTKSLFMIF